MYVHVYTSMCNKHVSKFTKISKLCVYTVNTHLWPTHTCIHVYIHMYILFSRDPYQSNHFPKADTYN